MDNSQKIEQIIQGMTKFNSETKEILDSVKERMDEVLNQHYHVNENPIVLKTLEQEYEDILATNGDYEYSSAVGYRAILKNGDTVRVTGNSGHFFLNGERMTADYTYTGDGCEMVSVWVFENVGDMLVAPISLNDTPSFTPYEIIIKNIAQTPTVTRDYYLYSQKVTIDGFNLGANLVGNKKLIVKGFNYFPGISTASAQEVYSDCEVVNGSVLKDRANLKKISLPNCKTISADYYNSPFAGCKSLKIMEFGALETITGISNDTTMTFRDADTVYIPDTVKTINGGPICYRNKTIKLECNKATSIVNNWCYGTPSSNFTMAKDWLASVNISVAAKNWSKDKFIDLFENYLFDLSVVGDDGSLYAERELTIPKAIYDVLTDEEFAIAENKGWIVGGA